MANGDGRDDDGFLRFWAVYPRKCAKGDARKAWEQTVKIRPPLERLIKAVIVAKASEQWRKDGGQFIPHPARYLRGERWEDVHEIDLELVRDGKAWDETASGIEAQAEKLGIAWEANESFQQFAARVRRAFNSLKVVPINRAA
jgi:hypothetical protein